MDSGATGYCVLLYKQRSAKSVYVSSFEMVAVHRSGLLENVPAFSHKINGIRWFCRGACNCQLE